jgi:hypothetical protein
MDKKSLLKFSSWVIALLTCNFVISCAIVYPIDGSESSTTKRLNFVDARPDIEKVFRPYSQGSEPIHRFGDENFQPDRMTILEQAFQNRLNGSFSGSTARIKKFEVIAFCPKGIGMSRGYSEDSFEMMFGPIFGSVLYKMGAPKGKDFFACHIEGDIDGKGFKVFDKEEYDGLIDMGAAKKAVNILIKRTIDMAVKEINSSI